MSYQLYQRKHKFGAHPFVIPHQHSFAGDRETKELDLLPPKLRETVLYQE